MKRWPEAGIIFCEKEQCACAYCSMKDGSCLAARCNIHDEEYVKEKEAIRQHSMYSFK